MTIRRLLITEVRIGDKMSETRSGFRTVADVRISYTAAGADGVRVTFADGVTISRFPDTPVYVKH